jgi:sterol desaturase/sphingolipid hydroxylase (fatty acid hydroxylase superfamily)
MVIGMDIFQLISDELIGWLALLGVDKQAIKAAFEAYGLEPLWAVLRGVYFNPHEMLFAVPLLLLWRIRPADNSARTLFSGYVVLDFLYPIFVLPIQATVIVGGISVIDSFFKTHIPFLKSGLVDGQPLWIQGLAAIVIVDFMFYVAHWLKHKIPWLWYFHAVHHSQRQLNPFTTFRNHPFEALINAAIKTVPIAAIGGTRPTWFLFAVIDGIWGYFIHSGIRTNLGPLKYILVTPQNHWLHHTINPEQIDRNFGERLTAWDWLFGTIYKDFDAYPETGIKGYEWIEEKSARPFDLIKAFVLQFVYPFWMIGRDLQRSLLRWPGGPRTAPVSK